MNLVILVPTYNEASTITSLIERIEIVRTDLKAVCGGEVRLLVIDDNSPDGTSKLVKGLAKSWIDVLDRQEKAGLGPAYIAGFTKCLSEGFDLLVEMDADLSHQPEQLIDMAKPVATGEADLTIGTRWMPGGRIENWPWSRQMISKAGTGYARLVLRIGLRDITSGFRVFHSRVLKAVDLEQVESRGYGFQIEMALRTLEKGFRIKEVPITFVERADGVSKMSKAIVLEALWKVTIWGFQRLLKRR